MPKSRRKNLLLTSSLLSQGFLLNPQTSLERPAGLKTNRQRYFANQTTSMRITETTTQKWKWNSFTRSCRMPRPTRVELSLSLQPWFLPIKESLSYQMTRFYVNKLSTTTSFGISKASKWCLERSRASLFSQQIGLRNKMLLADILVVFGYLDLKFCMLVPDVIAFTVLKKILAIRNSHFNLQEYLTIYITWGAGCLGACWSFDFTDAWKEDLHIPESIVFTLHCYSWSVLYPLSSPNIYHNLCFVLLDIFSVSGRFRLIWNTAWHKSWWDPNKQTSSNNLQ